MPDAVVIGAGPVGLLLAGELVRRGLDVEVLERRPSASPGSRAIGIHSPALTLMEPSGVTERLLSGALRVPRGEARSRGRVLGVVRFDRLSTRFPFVATLPQAETEAILSAAAPGVLRGAKVIALQSRGDEVVVRATVGGRVTERRSAVVIVAGGAEGRELLPADPTAVHTYRDRYLMADAVAGDADEETAIVHLDRGGVLESFPLPGGRRRYVAWDRPDADQAPQARLARLRQAVAARGEASDAIDAASAFGVRRFVAGRWCHGRIVALGDTAHEVSPIGGQGMNLGFLDAVTLAPLVAEWVRSGSAPLGLAGWERRRASSARRAARLAAVNTMLGRPLAAPGDALRRGALRAMLAPPVGDALARAYAMGFDRDARSCSER